MNKRDKGHTSQNKTEIDSNSCFILVSIEEKNFGCVKKVSKEYYDIFG